MIILHIVVRLVRLECGLLKFNILKKERIKDMEWLIAIGFAIVCIILIEVKNSMSRKRAANLAVLRDTELNYKEEYGTIELKKKDENYRSIIKLFSSEGYSSYLSLDVIKERYKYLGYGAIEVPSGTVNNDGKPNTIMIKEILLSDALFEEAKYSSISKYLNEGRKSIIVKREENIPKTAAEKNAQLDILTKAFTTGDAYSVGMSYLSLGMFRYEEIRLIYDWIFDI